MEHGGRGLPGAYNAILSYEAAYARAPGVYHSVYIIGPSLSAFGSEEQRRFFLPKIARGEVEFLLGYSEPGAGSDLAGVETSAVADGDEYVINGQKSFSTHAQRAEYAWMIARTNPDVPRHRGLSLFVVPMTTEGITVRPIPTVAGWDHAEVFFENVRVPKTALVGEKDRGWYHLMTAIDFERSGFLYYGEAQRLFDELLDFCRSTRRNGAPLTKDPLVRRELARMRTEIDAGRRSDEAHRLAPAVGAGAQHRGQSINKVWATEMIRRICRVGTQIMGHYGTLMPMSPHLPGLGQPAYGHLETIRSPVSIGANEVQRNIIAQRGLGMPRG